MFPARNVTSANDWRKKKLGRKESLSGKAVVDTLFSKGSHFFIYPLRFVFLPLPENTLAETLVLFSVSKRNFKKATDRNLLKRRLREAYRLNKSLYPLPNPGLHLAFIYSAKEIRDFHFIQEKLNLGLKRLSEKLSSPNEHEASNI